MTQPLALPMEPATWNRGRVGMACLIFGESTFFSVFVVAYLFYIGKSASGPQPSDVLEFPVFATVCLLSSSATAGLAVKALTQSNTVRAGLALALTVGLGAGFLGATANEWFGLIYGHGLTIGTNLFGTTFYSLVGFHAAHVGLGLLMLTLVLGGVLGGKVGAGDSERVEMVTWYWHFVDAVWIVVLTTVYVVGV
ncbi:MAG TPA: heme-copper oxidase subunit III [Myxococcales bacterium]|nr:heme-copper oxidase subunit III [Myxococcales bacterium]